MTPPDVIVYSKPDRPFAAKLRAKLVVSRTPHNAVRFQDDPAAAGEIRNMNDGKEIVLPAAVTSSMACSVMSSSRNGSPTVWWHCESTPVGHAEAGADPLDHVRARQLQDAGDRAPGGDVSGDAGSLREPGDDEAVRQVGHGGETALEQWLHAEPVGPHHGRST